MKENDNHRHSEVHGAPALGLAMGRGRCAVQLELLRQGRDLILRITGGQAHIGAVAVCMGGTGRSQVRDGAQTLELSGHREGALASESAETVALVTGCTCAAVVGIHQDQATPDEIKAIVANARQGLQKLLAARTQEETP